MPLEIDFERHQCIVDLTGARLLETQPDPVLPERHMFVDDHRAVAHGPTTCRLSPDGCAARDRKDVLRRNADVIACERMAIVEQEIRSGYAGFVFLTGANGAENFEPLPKAEAAGHRMVTFRVEGVPQKFSSGGSTIVKLNLSSDSWDAFFKMLSIVLVPLTVAGMGWYWTKWQQSVNDLKSMIDLVTDPSAEKQKYGIAMFEYLAKNGKVPVEFVAAQIDYATSAKNPELLPMLEIAILNAAKENPDVAAAYKIALERRPSRVFVHVPDEPIYQCLTLLRDSFKEEDKATIRFPAVRMYADYAQSNQELRFFHPGDKVRAAQISGLFASLGLHLEVKDLSSSTWARSNAPNSYELWFSGHNLPALCREQAKASG